MTPGARARRALIFDVIAAALIAALVLSLTAGLGVVAFFALPLLLLGLLWIAVERLVVWLKRRRQRDG
jgi:predicted PurR-regulated permease PerM